MSVTINSILCEDDVALDSLDLDPPEVKLVRDFEDFLEHLPHKDASDLLDAFHRWREALLKLPTRDLPLKNLAAEYHLLDPQKLLLLLETARHYLRHGTDPLLSLASGCMAFIDLGDPIEEAVGELARFMDFDLALELYLPLFGSNGVYYDPNGRLWKEQLSRTEIVREPELFKGLKDRIRGGGDVNAFSTLASWVDSHTSTNSAELAGLVRDKLGLPHLATVSILEIRIPEEAARASGLLRKPTFADSRGYPPFLPSQREDKYGYARDLSVEDPESRGGPEVWHGPVKAALVSGLRFLGRPMPELKRGMWSAFVGL